MVDRPRTRGRSRATHVVARLRYVYDLRPWSPRVRDTATLEHELGERAFWAMLRENYRVPVYEGSVHYG